MRPPHLFWFLILLLLHSPALAAPADAKRIAVLGDSLSAGYGLAAPEAFPAQLETALRRRGHRVQVVNAAVSGDTSAGGLARLDWTLSEPFDLVIVELGANDALRGLDPQHTRDNLAAILSRIEASGARSLLAGMHAPRNLGRDYYLEFDRLFPELARERGVPLYPFFLAGVAGKQELNLADGIHPNAAGVVRIVELILPLVEESLK